MYKRVQYQTITKRLKEPRHFLQVVLGPRQVGKLSLIHICISLLQAQPVRVSETLKELDMENISVVEKRDTITAAFETCLLYTSRCV